jgi:hypothetical protein
VDLVTPDALKPRMRPAVERAALDVALHGAYLETLWIDWPRATVGGSRTRRLPAHPLPVYSGPVDRAR